MDSTDEKKGREMNLPYLDTQQWVVAEIELEEMRRHSQKMIDIYQAYLANKNEAGSQPKDDEAA